AGPAQMVALDERHLPTCLREGDGEEPATLTGTDDDRIVVGRFGIPSFSFYRGCRASWRLHSSHVVPRAASAASSVRQARRPAQAHPPTVPPTMPPHWPSDHRAWRLPARLNVMIREVPPTWPGATRCYNAVGGTRLARGRAA